MSETQETQLTKKDFVSDQAVRWCPGCGDYAILAQMQKALQIDQEVFLLNPMHLLLVKLL